MPIAKDNWVRIMRFNGSFLGNVSILENRFKIDPRWYLTPRHMAKMFLNIEGRCWRCQGLQADFIHMWWTCTNLEKFWKGSE